MCRIVAYFGQDNLLLEDILVKPENSLVNQSHRIRNNGRGLHADGFGVAWYDFSLEPRPGIFKSIQPAWNDYNIQHLARKISSNCMLGHVRSSTVGDVVLSNCHPFEYDTYSMVHNGTIRNFDKYKMQFIHEIDEDLFLKIKGNTDTEFFFYLIMTYLRKQPSLILAVKQAIAWVVEIQGSDDIARINIVLTDGNELIATCFANNADALTLQFLASENSCYIASEPLDAESDNWVLIKNRSLLHIQRKDFKYRVQSL